MLTGGQRFSLLDSLNVVPLAVSSSLGVLSSPLALELDLLWTLLLKAGMERTRRPY